jgi:hypothetical protein
MSGGGDIPGDIAGDLHGDLHGVPPMSGLVEAVREFLEGELMPSLEGRQQFLTRVSVNALRMVERELALGPGQADAHTAGLARLGLADEAALAAAIRNGDLDDRRDEVVSFVRATVRGKLEVANPRYLDA